MGIKDLAKSLQVESTEDESFVLQWKQDLLWKTKEE